MIIKENECFWNMCNTHTHITLYSEVIFLSWGGSILSKDESPVTILFLEFLAYFSLSYFLRITILVCSYCT